MSVRSSRTVPRIGAVLGAGVLTVGLAACGGGPPGQESAAPAQTGGAEESPAPAEETTVTVYSGREEELVDPLLEQMEEATGLDVEVRYGGSAELAAQILEEGEGSPADVYFSQDAGSLGAVSEEGLLAELPAELLSVVPEPFRAGDGTWVGTSARARAIAYNPELVSEEELPQSLDDLLDPRWRGQIGYAPTNGSWQAFVTGLRVVRGEDGAREWLAGFAANDPQRFEGNNAILGSVDAGQTQLGLINHYYWYRLVEELGAQDVTAQLHFVGGGDPLGLVNVAGVGVLESTEDPEAAQATVEFLLSEQAQQYFADETAEYPVREGVTSTGFDLPPISSLSVPDIDLSDLASLEETLALLQETGLA